MRSCLFLTGPTVLAVLAGLVPLAQAQGFNLTGLWTGQTRCKVYDGILIKDTLEFGPGNPVKILQTGNTLAVETQSGIFGFAYHGEAVQDTRTPERGRAIMMECRSSPALDGYSEVVRLQGTVGPDRGRLRGHSIVRTLFGEVGRCTWLLNRTSPENPVITNCSCCP